MSGLVLAGGEGRRMGAPKALVPFLGAPLVTYAVLTLCRLADEVLVACGRQSGVPLREAVGPEPILLADDGDGPMAGLRAGASAAAGERLLVLPVDAPLASHALLGALLRASEGRDAAMVRLDRRAQPLVACYERAKLREALGVARVPRELPALLDVAWVEEGALARQARDADTPEELDALAREALTGGRGAR